MSTARVRSLDALVDLKAALCTFAAQAKEALSSVEMAIRRTQDWLDEQLKFWKTTVQKCEEEVFLAKQELARKRMMRYGDRPPDTSEQEKDLRIAQHRLEHAEEKLEATRRWLRQFPEATFDYEGPAGQLAAQLEADWPKADAFLEQKILALEAYLQLSQPSPPEGKP